MSSRPAAGALDVLRRGVESNLHVGGQLYVSRRGEVVCDDAVGTADGQRPLDPATAMPLLCAGKPFTSVAVGIAVDRGQLAFDQPVVELIEEWDEARAVDLRLSHLLTHSVPFPGDPAVGTFAADWPRIVQRVTRTRLDRSPAPGELARYTVLSSWFLLGEILQRVTGRDIVDLLRDEVIEPTGSLPCSLRTPSEANRSLLFDTSAGTPTPSFLLAGSETGDVPSPGLGMWGTASALGRFYEELLAVGRGDRSVPLICPATLATMTTTHRRGLACPVYASSVEWGLGFVTDGRVVGGRESGPRNFGHDGRHAGLAFADPDRDLVVVILTNGMPRPARSWRRFRAMVDAVYRELDGPSPNGRS